MSNLYVSLEEVIKLLNEHPSSNTNKIIQSLPEPINLSVIDEMIGELIPASSFGTGIINSHKIDTLQELKQRLVNDKPYPGRLITPSGVIN